MPGGDGIEATRTITADPSLSTCRVLVLTMFELDEYVQDALRDGASGFLLTDRRVNAGLGALTERETVVPGLVGQGLSNDEIATNLTI